MAEGSKAGAVVGIVIIILFLCIPLVCWYLTVKGVLHVFDRFTKGGKANERFNSVSKALGGAASKPAWQSSGMAGSINTPITGGGMTGGKYDMSFSDHCDF